MPSMQYSRKPAYHIPDHRQDAALLAIHARLDAIADRVRDLDDFISHAADATVAAAQQATDRAELEQLAGRMADVAGADQALRDAKAQRAVAILEREDLLAERDGLHAKLPVVRAAAKEKAVLALRNAYKAALAAALPLCQQAAAAEVALADISEQAVILFPDHLDDVDGFAQHASIVPRFDGVRYQPDGEYVIQTRLSGLVDRLEKAAANLAELERREQAPGRR